MLRGHFSGVPFVGHRALLSLPAPQSLFGLFMLFLVSWTITGTQVFSIQKERLQIQLPVFILIGLASVFAGVCFYRMRKKMPFVGAGMLSLGFLLWGIYLGSYPFSLQKQGNTLHGFSRGGGAAIVIAVSMIVLVLEEARYYATQMKAEIAAVRSEKEALQVKVLTTEEKNRSLYDQARLTEDVQKAYEGLRQTQQVVVRQERLRAWGRWPAALRTMSTTRCRPWSPIRKCCWRRSRICRMPPAATANDPPGRRGHLAHHLAHAGILSQPH